MTADDTVDPAHPVDTIDRPIAHLVRAHRGSMVALAVVSFVGGLMEAAFLVVITRAAFAATQERDLVDIPGGFELTIGATLVVALVLVALRIAASLLASWRGATLLGNVTAELRRRLAEAYLGASWATQQREKDGQLQELMTNFANQGVSVVSALVTSLNAGFNLAAILGLAVIVNPAASGVVLGTVLVLTGVLWPFRRLVERQAKRQVGERSAFASQLSELSQVGMEVHVFGVQPQLASRVDGLIDANRRRQRTISYLQSIVPTLYSGLAYAAMAIAVAVIAASDASQLSSLGAALLLMLRSLFNGQTLQAASLTVMSSRPFIVSLFEKLATYEAARQVDHGEPIDRVGTLALERVGFEYVEGQPVLVDVDAVIHAHEVVGIIGPSGSGKSTMVQLLLGLRQPTTGRVLADGRDIRRFSRHEWARRVTFVPQTPHLVSGTVTENIRFFRDGVSDADVERAARLAHLHDDVVNWPEGYDRDVGPHGSNLSGGQQQRLCIARALVERPDVLILDEPTSALDGRSEALIRESFNELRESMTVVVIAHRLSTLAMCDRLMVVQDGRLLAFDTPEELERSSGFYREALIVSGLR